MNAKPFLLSATIALGLFASAAYAETPLAVTDFHPAYADVPAVQQAKAAGKLTNELAAFLSGPNAIAEKAAAINALYNKGKKHNAKLFRDHLGKSQGAAFNVDSLSADEQFALGYLTAMDDPSQAQKALPMLEKARSMMPDSFTVAMITAITKAEQHKGKQACRGWKLIEEVHANESLNMDMREEAVDLIEEQMGQFAKEDCK